MSGQCVGPSAARQYSQRERQELIDRAEKAEARVAELEAEAAARQLPWCHECKVAVSWVDEDGCCTACGSDAVFPSTEHVARIAELEKQLKPRPISEAPQDGSPVRVWVTTTSGCGAWFDARCRDGVWRESVIRHIGHGFEEVDGRVLRPIYFVEPTPPPG